MAEKIQIIPHLLHVVRAPAIIRALDGIVVKHEVAEGVAVGGGIRKFAINDIGDSGGGMGSSRAKRRARNGREGTVNLLELVEDGLPLGGGGRSGQLARGHIDVYPHHLVGGVGPSVGINRRTAGCAGDPHPDLIGKAGVGREQSQGADDGQE